MLTELSLKDQIADAFQRHFHQFGFKKTVVDDVAHELQISKKTIYQQFSSKEEILEYVIQRNSKGFLQELMAALPQKADEAVKLEQLIRLIHNVARDFYQRNVSFELQFRQEIAETAYHQAYAQLLADLISSGIEKGIFNSSNPDLTIRFIDLIVSESVRWMIQNPESAVNEATVQTVLKILR